MMIKNPIKTNPIKSGNRDRCPDLKGRYYINRLFGTPKSSSKIEWNLTNGPRSVSCDRAIRYSGLGVREKWVLLEIAWIVGEK